MQGKFPITNINIDLLIPNKYQPRKIFNPESINELASSIKEYGILNPILVRKKEDKYEIIAGERRYQAAKTIGLQEVPVIIKELSDHKTAEIALIENIQRENLNPLEEAKAYKEILNLTNLNQEDLAKKIGKSQSFIANKIRLLSLSESVQNALLNKKISERHARTLLKITKNKQEEYLNKIIKNKLSVKELENLIKQEKNNTDEIEMTISDIMKSIQKEEKESDNMNNGNFFPNFNNQMPLNNNMSLNNLNMQSMGGTPIPPVPETVMPTNQIIQPQAIPEANPFINNQVNAFVTEQPQNIISEPVINQAPVLEQPIQPQNIEKIIESQPTQPLFNMEQQNIVSEPVINQAPILEQPIQPENNQNTEPTQPLFNIELQNIVPEPTINEELITTPPVVTEPIQPENNQAVEIPQMQNEEFPPLMDSTPQQTIEQLNVPTTEPIMEPQLTNEISLNNQLVADTPIPDFVSIPEPPIFNNPPKEEEPITPFDISNTAPQTFEVPVTEETPTKEDKLTKTTDILNKNNISYKLYSNEKGHCIIIEL